MEPTEKPVKTTDIKISEKQLFDENTTKDYVAFLKAQGETVQKHKRAINFADPNYKDTSEHAQYWKVLDHAGILSDGGRLLRGIEYDENGKESFFHKATNTSGETVGYEITWITQKNNANTVNGEFVGVGFNNTDPKTALQLLEARHQVLLEMGIHDYEISMEYRTANVLKRMGTKLQLIEQNGDQDTATYKIFF